MNTFPTDANATGVLLHSLGPARHGELRQCQCGHPAHHDDRSPGGCHQSLGFGHVYPDAHVQQTLRRGSLQHGWAEAAGGTFLLPRRPPSKCILWPTTHRAAPARDSDTGNGVVHSLAWPCGFPVHPCHDIPCMQIDICAKPLSRGGPRQGLLNHCRQGRPPPRSILRPRHQEVYRSIVRWASNISQPYEPCSQAVKVSQF